MNAALCQIKCIKLIIAHTEAGQSLSQLQTAALTGSIILCCCAVSIIFGVIAVTIFVR